MPSKKESKMSFLESNKLGMCKSMELGWARLSPRRGNGGLSLIFGPGTEEAEASSAPCCP